MPAFAGMTSQRNPSIFILFEIFAHRGGGKSNFDPSP
jgi:hypothetical protein